MRQKNENEIYIINHYSEMSTRQIANELHLSIGQVEYYVRKNHLRKGKFKFSEKENKFMQEHYLDMGYKEIASILGYTERQIRGRINNMNLTKIRKINSKYFNKINTPLKAYFLGFIFADGWVVYNEKTRNYELGMELQSKDVYILEKLNEELGGLNIIYHSEPHIGYINEHESHSGHTDYLRVYSKQLVLDLINHGIETNKTKKEIYPIVSDDLFFDFLRGYIDGDGCYWNFKGNYYLHITCSFPNILNYLKDKLDTYGIKTGVYKEKDGKYRLMCTSIESMKRLIPLLYYSPDVFCLERKYDRIKSYLYGLAI